MKFLSLFILSVVFVAVQGSTPVKRAAAENTRKFLGIHFKK